MYWIKRKVWQIRNVIKWLPIIWGQFDFDYSYAIEVFKFQLQKTSHYLNSDKALTISAKNNAKRLQTIIDLMDKVYDEYYGMEYYDKISELYGEDKFKYKFIPCEDKESYRELKYSYELTETPEMIEEIANKYNELFKESNKKQKKAHKLLWDLIEHNIKGMWD
tara:strand:- start:764 stop:1255 length:492 start_codon:yes stop_codon:yes gene_type:complete